MGRQDDHDFSFFLKEQHNCKLKLDMQMVRLPLYIIYWVCFRRVGTCSDCIEAAHSWGWHHRASAHTYSLWWANHIYTLLLVSTRICRQGISGFSQGQLWCFLHTILRNIGSKYLTRLVVKLLCCHGNHTYPDKCFHRSEVLAPPIHAVQIHFILIIQGVFLFSTSIFLCFL